jgi:predicted NAD/FAD-dependent oxidoreductase
MNKSTRHTTRLIKKFAQDLQILLTQRLTEIIVGLDQPVTAAPVNTPVAKVAVPAPKTPGFIVTPKATAPKASKVAPVAAAPVAKAPKAPKAPKAAPVAKAAPAAPAAPVAKAASLAGTTINTKPCPVCATPTKARRYSYLCEQHRTAENLAKYKGAQPVTAAPVAAVPPTFVVRKAKAEPVV